MTMAESCAQKTQESNPLEPYRIDGVTESMYYIHDFLSAEECDALVAKIPANRWISLSRRRLQAYPSQLTKSRSLLAGSLPSWLTEAPAHILQRFERLGVFDGCSPADIRDGQWASSSPRPNHVLVNEYLSGQGIMPHEDGAAYWPVVATVSLGSSLALDLYTKKNEADDGEPDGQREPQYRIFQEPGSLLVTRGSAYGCMLHGIAEIHADENLNASTVANWALLGDTSKLADGHSVRDTRVSLTYRIVRKVSKINMAMLGVGIRKT